MVFPAHAGMSRPLLLQPAKMVGFPRSRGDEPLKSPFLNQSIGFSPLTRG